MGLFSRKKVVNQSRGLPELPRFPEGPARQDNSTTKEATIPRYEPAFQKTVTEQGALNRQPSEQERLNANIPARQPAFLRPDPLAAEPKNSVAENKMPYNLQSNAQAQNDRPMTEAIWRPPMQQQMQQPMLQQMPQQAQPFQQPMQQMQYSLPSQMQMNERLPRPEEARVEEKPVFVRLQQYREAMSSIELLKQKIQDVEFIIGKIEELRAQEQIELNSCQNTLNRVKEKLITIDKKLFEV